jgi:Zn-dependent protease
LGLGVEFWVKAVLLCLFAVALLVAIIPHEVAHGYAALKMGDPTAKLSGRLTLNPQSHIDPVGLLGFCLVGIGWAKPVPVNPFNYRNFKKGNFWVSVAGVITNLILAFVLSLIFFFVDRYGKIDNYTIYFLYQFLWLCIILNVTLAIFNMLPVYPLDGFNLLVSFTKPNNRYMNFVRQNSMFMLVLVMVLVYFTSFISILQGFIFDGFLWLWGLVFAWL